MADQSPAVFFEPDSASGADGAFCATELARGPWSSDHAHGGPPAALLARAMERALDGGEPFFLALVTVEFLRPVPLVRLVVRAAVERSGRMVRYLTASLTTAEEGREVARARAVAIREAAVGPLGFTPSGGDAVALPSPQESAPFEFPFFRDTTGYHTAMEVRMARGEFGRGDVAAWMRMREALVPGEAPSPLQRVLTAADSGNGVSAALDLDTFTFVNPDLTVYLHRPLEGEWVCLVARVYPEAQGVGLATTDLYDVRGRLGRGAQSLVLARR